MLKYFLIYIGKNNSKITNKSNENQYSITQGRNSNVDLVTVTII